MLNARAQLNFCLFRWSGLSAYRMVPSQFRLGPSTLINLTLIYLQIFVSMVILNAIQITVKINHHTKNILSLYCLIASLASCFCNKVG